MLTVATGSVRNGKLLSYPQELVIPLTPVRLWLLSNDASALVQASILGSLPCLEGRAEQIAIKEAFSLP